MKKSWKYLLYVGVLVFAIAIIYIIVNPNNKTQPNNTDTQKNSQQVEVQENRPAEKVQVYVFHSTNRCYSCITMGKYTKETVEKFFQPELQSGKIEFKEINVDLPGNREIAAKFKATGSSLFINAITDGKDNIRQEVQAWRLLGKQNIFHDYLSAKIKTLL